MTHFWIPGGEFRTATPAVLFLATQACLSGIIYLALAYLHLKRLNAGPWGARIGRFLASRLFVGGGLNANVCLRCMEQAA